MLRLRRLLLSEQCHEAPVELIALAIGGDCEPDLSLPVDQQEQVGVADHPIWCLSARPAELFDQIDSAGVRGTRRRLAGRSR